MKINNLIGIKFKHKDSKDIIYTISEIKNDRVKITWINYDNENDYTHYDLRTVINCLKSDVWINIKLERELKLKKINKIATNRSR